MIKLVELYKFNYKKFPLSSLIKFAKKFDTFEEFEHFYSIDLNHGYYWHITDVPHFNISDKTGPRDMSSLSSGRISGYGDIMLTGNLEYWDSYYNDEIDSDGLSTGRRDIKRPYAALFDASAVDPKYLKQVARGFDNEIYLKKEQAKLLKLVGVYKINYAKTLQNKFQNMIPQSAVDLKKLYMTSIKDR